MSVALRFVRHSGSGPGLLQVNRDLREFMKLGRQDAVAQIRAMILDLERSGRSCRYLRKMKGTALWELKPSTRGGHEGGARVYLAFWNVDEIVIFNAEIKPPGSSAPSSDKFRQAQRLLRDYAAGTLVAERNHSFGTEDEQ